MSNAGPISVSEKVLNNSPPKNVYTEYYYAIVKVTLDLPDKRKVIHS